MAASDRRPARWAASACPCARASPSTLYAAIATERLGEDPSGASNGERKYAGFLGGQVENVQDKQGADGFQTGGVFRSDDGGESWRRVNSLNPRPDHYSQIRVDPVDPERCYVLGPNYYVSKDGGKSFEEAGGHRLHPISMRCGSIRPTPSPC